MSDEYNFVRGSEKIGDNKFNWLKVSTVSNISFNTESLLMLAIFLNINMIIGK